MRARAMRILIVSEIGRLPGIETLSGYRGILCWYPNWPGEVNERLSMRQRGTSLVVNACPWWL